MHKKLTTVWVTVVTLIAITLSSVASGASLMPLKMTATETIKMSMASDTHDSHCAPTEITIQVKQDNPCCDSDDMMSDHQCCPSSCVMSYTLVSAPFSLSPQVNAQTLITIEPVSHTNAIINALFRPPIA